MKETYIKPELDSKPYAQFESVFADCNKTPGIIGCVSNPLYNENDGASYSKHQNL